MKIDILWTLRKDLNWIWEHLPHQHTIQSQLYYAQILQPNNCASTYIHFNREFVRKNSLPAPGFEPMSFPLASSLKRTSLLTAVCNWVLLGITLPLLVSSSLGVRLQCSHWQHYSKPVRPIEKVSNCFTNAPELPGILFLWIFIWRIFASAISSCPVRNFMTGAEEIWNEKVHQNFIHHPEKNPGCKFLNF